jgi:hypothetical protein
MQYNNLHYCIRSHEVQKNGYSQIFEGELLTIFSSKSNDKKVKPNILIINNEREFEFREIKHEALL